MRIVIAGGHGQVARRLIRLLVANGDTPVAIVRNPEHVADVTADGAGVVLLDLERTDPEALAGAVAGSDGVVFAAGAGPGSGPERKDTVDRAAAAALADAASHASIPRFVLLSSMGAGKEPAAGTDDAFAAYLRAKTASEKYLRAQELDWTILRPGVLTDDPGTGRVRLDAEVPPGPVSRDDVAAVILALLHEPRASGLILELTAGDVPIDAAVAAVTELED